MLNAIVYAAHSHLTEMKDSLLLIDFHLTGKSDWDNCGTLGIGRVISWRPFSYITFSYLILYYLYLSTYLI